MKAWEPQKALAWLAFSLIICMAGISFRHLLTTPILSVSAPVMSADSSASPQDVNVTVDFPPELVVITHTPVPTAIPTPTYAVLPTPLPLLCGNWVSLGDVCTMPADPDPTPTPLAECPVEGGAECIWQGRMIPTSTQPTPELAVPMQYGS